jgi:Tfp pilus assembly protein PilN
MTATTTATSREPEAPGQQTVTRSRVEWAPVPKVNLLPPEVLEGRRFAHTRRMLGVAVLGTVLACGAGVAWAQVGVDAAQEQLDATQAQTRILQAEQARYADVPAILSQVTAAQTARERALAQDVPWYRFLTDLARSTPSDVSLESLTVTLKAPAPAAAGGAATAAAPGAPGAPGGAADALTPAGIGEVSFTGTAGRYPDVAAWLEAVAEVQGLDGSTLRSATKGEEGEDGVQWTSSIQVASDALSHRYDRKAS